MKRLRILGLSILVTMVGATAALAATFDGTPSAPTPVSQIPDYSTLDVQVHSRDSSSWFTLPPIQAEHGSDCSAPPATHTNTSYEGTVYQCANHIMTAINGSAGYAEVVLTPNLLFDFTNGGSVTWEMSTEKMSVRDWWDLTIAPWNQSLTVPLLSNLSQGVDLNGTAMNAVHVGTDNGEGAPALSLVKNGSTNCALSNCAGWALTRLESGIPGSVNQAASRQPFKLTIANGRIRFERLASSTAPAVVYWDVAATPSFTVGVVQFAQHSYTPTKDGAGEPATWHWDNLDAQPSTPFTIIHASPRATSGGVVTFDAPAPAGAYLRFSAICRPVVNGVTATRQDSALVGQSYHPEHFSSYFVSVPEGSTSATVSFGADGWYSGPCLMNGATLWSLSAASAEPTSTPTNTPPPPTATPTAVPATATPIATATNTPTSTPVATVTNTPTPTAIPTATPTATPTQEVCRARRGTSIFGQVLYTGHIQNGVCIP